MEKRFGFEKVSIVLLLVIVFSQLVSVSWNTKVVMVSCQPETIKYGPFDPYCVFLKRKQHTLSVAYSIVVTKKMDSNYGYVINYPLDSVSTKDIRTTSVRWSNDGVTVVTNLGTIVFVPKENFVGGR